MEILKANNLFCELFEFSPNNPNLERYKEHPYEMLQFSCDNLLQEEFDELHDAILNKNDVEIIDGAIDCAVIALNIAYKLFRLKGFESGEAYTRTYNSFGEVIKSNLSKVNDKGEASFNESGKVIKGSSYFAPNLTPYLEPVKIQETLN